MRFVRASEFQFEPHKTYFAKRGAGEPDEIKGTGWFQSDGVFFWEAAGYVPVLKGSHDSLLILDESLSASITDEAERLYPFPEDNESGVYDDLKNIREWCRSAHIAAARQYMDTIEKLKAELEQSLLLYNNQTATILKLQAENSKMRKALEAIAYFTSVDLNWMKQTAVEALK